MLNRFLFALIPLLLTSCMSTTISSISTRDGSSITTSSTSLPLEGHYKFCLRHPADCKTNKVSAPLHMTNELWKKFLIVNSEVNLSIQPESDMVIYGQEEYWEYPKTVGDCEDYVLLKKKMLQSFGISPSVLLIAAVRRLSGEAHAVLIIRTTDGDYVMDNLHDDIERWDETEYEYLKIQSAKGGLVWLDVEDHGRIW